MFPHDAYWGHASDGHVSTLFMSHDIKISVHAKS